MKRIYLYTTLLLCAILGTVQSAHASHAQGADLTYRYLSTDISGSKCYEVTFTFYRDCTGIPAGTTQSLSVFDSCLNTTQNFTLNLINGLPCPYGGFSGATGCEVSQLCQPVRPSSTCNGASAYPGVQKYVYRDTICTSSTCAVTRLSVAISARNGSNSLASSGDLYIEATFNNNYNNSSAVFAYDPVPFVCAGYPQAYLNGGVDPNGDSLVYEMVTPLLAHGSQVTYNAGYSVTNPIQTVAASYYNFSTVQGELDFTPLLTTAATTSTGEVDVLAVRVYDYRYDTITNKWLLMGSTMRDVQVKILQCVQSPPEIDTVSGLVNGINLDTATIKVCPGVQATWDIFLRSPNFKNISFLTSLNSAVSPLPGAVVTSVDLSQDTIKDSVNVHVTWTPQLSDTGCHYYQVTAINEDCPIQGEKTKTYRVCVSKSVSVSPHSVIYCGTAIKLTSTGGSNPVWSPLTGLTTTSNPFQVYAAPSVTTKYTFNSDCGSDTALVIYNPPFLMAAGPGGQICKNGLYQFHAFVDNTYSPYKVKWLPGAWLQDANGNANDTILEPYGAPPITTTYVVQFTASTGCVRRDTVTLVVNGAASAINAKAIPTVVCPNDTATLIALAVPSSCDIGSVPCTGNIVSGKIGSGITAYGGGSSSYPSVYGAATRSARHQFLIRASDILAITNTGGQIQSIGFYVRSVSGTVTLSNYTISMECTYADSMPSTPNPTYIPVSKVVFNPQTVTVTAVGLVTHVLNNPYDWDGKSNLIIDVCFTNATGGGTNPKLEFSPTTYPALYCTYGNSNTQCGNTGSQSYPFNAANYKTRPNIYISLCQTKLQGANILWTPNTGPNTPLTPTLDTTQAVVHSTQTYIVTLTDGNGCKSADFVTVNIDTSHVLHIGNDTFICSTVSTVPIHATLTGTFNPANISYEWYTLGNSTAFSQGTGPTAASITVNPAATTTYYCKATGPSMCTLYDTIVVSVGTSIPITHTVDSITCFGANDGRIILSAAGASKPITYTWTPASIPDTAIASNLAPGTYTVSVVDGKGCLGRDTVTLVSPPQLVAPFTQTNITCFNYKNGTITVNASGGRPGTGYTYLWTPAQPTVSALTGLDTGKYSVTVTDQSSCTATASITITQPSGMTSSAVATPWSGNGTHDGTIKVTTTGGLTPYTYKWTNTVSTTDTAFNLDTICYMITVTDGNSCQVIDTACVAAPPPIVVVFSKTAEPCHGDCKAFATAVATGGVNPYSFKWSTGSSLDSIFNLCAGVYTLTITDSNGIKVVNKVTITEPPVLAVYLTKQDISCHGQLNGSISDSVVGGTPTYNTVWNPGGNIAPTNVGAGKYVVTITDQNNCVVKDSATINEPALLVATVASVTPDRCYGDSNGTTTINVVGGITPYKYTWSGSASTTGFANDLKAGVQYVTVTDKNNCIAIDTFTITQPNKIGAIANPTPAHCATSNDGSVVITLTGAGGVKPFTYSYNGGVATTQNTATNLSVGNNTVLITDSQGCKLNLPFPIDTFYALRDSLVKQDSVKCFGDATGSAQVLGLNGTGGYKYQWSPSGLNTNPATLLPAGVQYVTVTDAYGCILHDSVTVLQPAQIQITPYWRDPLCAGDLNGKVWIDIANGTAPFTYSIKGVTHLATDTVFFLGAGTYQINVTDAKGCVQTSTVTLTDPPALKASLTVYDISCANFSNGGMDVSASGGTQPYSYAWSLNRPEDTLLTHRYALGPGSYTVTVTDNNGCSVVLTKKLNSPPPITFQYLRADSVSCPGKKDGIIEVHVAGGTPGNIIPYEYSIDSVNFQTKDKFLDLAAGNYHLIVTDSNGCQADTIVTVYAPLPVTAQITPPDTTIMAGNNVQLLAVLGGNPNLPINSYTWYTSSGLSCSDCPAPIASPYSIEEYTLKINYGKNCYTYAAAIIHVVGDSDFYVPNAFTPNGDDLNDLFQVFGTGMRSVSMKVFDRWGEKVFDSGNVQWATWDGTYKGDSEPNGVYTYSVEVEFLNGTKKQKQGSVSIFR